MLSVITQLELLLAAVSAFMPLVPEAQRPRATQFLTLAAQGLSLGANVATNLDDLADKLALIRAEVEAMAEAGIAVSADQLDAAMSRVRAAAKALRAAAETAEAGRP
jgi:predicted alpha/beta-fold hydrolase